MRSLDHFADALGAEGPLRVREGNPVREPDHKSPTSYGMDGDDSEHPTVAGVVSVVTHYEKMIGWNDDLPVTLEPLERIILEDLIGFSIKRFPIKMEL